MAVDLPSGTVTFLFTDVEGSTQLFERHPRAYRDAITMHHAILRDTISHHRGVVFETVGDAVYGAFGSPHDAVAAALDAQRALLATPWGDLGSLKVRIGLHTGDVERQGDHYFGAALYRCARLMSAAHGQQVVLSSITAALVSDTLPVDVDLYDLGEHRLKDLQRPERVYQLRSPGLPSDFPPLRTLGHIPNNLPVQPSAFIGRRGEVDSVCALLRRPETRIVTLTGPGGVGKSRLGLHVAADALHDFGDGAFVVELAPVPSGDLVIATIGKTLGIQETTGRPFLESVKDYLRDKHLLLLLDNFEHVLTAASHIADLCASCAGVRALITSREALRIRGEQQFAVLPLAVPDSRAPFASLLECDAVKLFVERAAAVKVDFAISETNAGAIAEICRRLDGLPLAIELAAARVNVFSPQAMLARLANTLAVLTSGPRDVPARQQTLRQAIAWSHDLLTPDEQLVYRRLGVFVGGCALSSVEAVVDSTNSRTPAGVDVLTAMASLVDKSLLRQLPDVEVDPRFAMLETIREYALDRLRAAGEMDELRARHAHVFLALAEQTEPDLIGGPRQPEGFDRLGKEHDNLRAALRWLTRHGPVDDGLRLAAALRRFWRARGYLTEGRERLAELLAQPDARDSNPSRAKALHAAGWLAREQGDYGEARERFEESLVIYRRLADARGIGWGLVDLGFLTRYQGDYVTATAILEEGLGLLQNAGDREGVAAALGNLGLVARDRGQPEAAEHHLNASLALWREIGDRVGTGWVLTALGMVARAQQRHDVARHRLEESLAVWRDVGDRQNTANVLNALALVARDQGEHAVARARLEESLAIFVEVGDRRGVAFALEGFARLAAKRGEYVRAVCLGAAAAALRSLIGAPAPPAWQSDLEREMNDARRALAHDTFDRAHARGRSMTLREATALAMDAAGE